MAHNLSWNPEMLPPGERAEFYSHLRNSAFRGALEEAADAAERLADTIGRWQADCAADGVDPALERDYYRIDAKQAEVDHYLATAISLASR